MSAKTKILIVDDDRDIRIGLGARLKANGYEVSIASDGVTAVSSARKDPPDLILLDLGLPAGDGFVVLQRLHQMLDTSAIPVIVLSARDPAQNKERALEAGAAAYFQKPARSEELLVAIRGALGHGGAPLN